MEPTNRRALIPSYDIFELPPPGQGFAALEMLNILEVCVPKLGMNMQMTTDAARFTHNQTGNVLSLEANLFNLVGEALKAKGHNMRSVNGGSVGGYQGILFTRDPSLTAPPFDARAASEDLPVNGVYVPDPTIEKTGRPPVGRFD